MIQGGHEMTVGRGQGVLGRPEDGENGYLRHLSLAVIGQCENST
jgi:hypothetical protein